MRTLLTLIVAAMTGAACSSAAGPSLDPTKTNCDIVCQQEGTCGPSGFDVTGCENNCVNKSSDDTYKASVNDCATCVDGKSCTDSVGCSSNCLTTVTSF
jgi:hypothetical protein